MIVYTWPELQEVERQFAYKKLEFPYIPGFLSFREIPVLIEAIAKLKNEPDLFIFDGHGIAPHPRSRPLCRVREIKFVISNEVRNSGG